MFKINWNRKAIIETAKAAGRFVWFGLLGLIVLALGALAISPDIARVTLDVYGIHVNAGVAIIGLIGIISKGIDTYIHNNQEIKSNGIAPSFLQK